MSDNKMSGAEVLKTLSTAVEILKAAFGGSARPEPAVEKAEIAVSTVADLIDREAAQARRVAELEKDAERYRTLRGMHWEKSPLAVVADPKRAVHLGCDCPSLERLDTAIDSIISEARNG